MNGREIPKHVAVIMDGNGRWAAARGLERSAGHSAGAEKVPEIARYLFSRGVEVVSLYALSEENFSRPEAEVKGIIKRIEEFVLAFPSLFDEGKVRLVFSGDIDKAEGELPAVCRRAEFSTRSNKPYTLNVLLNYGGRSEILRAARLLCGKEGDEASFRTNLYNSFLPDPDLIIRTGGERRLSGFMPFQSAYAELYFTDVLFPDVTINDMEAALKDYGLRERRFGNI